MLAALWIAWQGEVARAEELVHTGRVRDACTAAPVEEAWVELFTEALYGEPELVAAARTDRTGSYALHDPERRGQKVRLRHERYRSRVDGTAEAEHVLFPRDTPVVFEIRDLAGEPIAGARVFLLQTCRHAVPTTEAVSDAQGRVELADLPALSESGDLSILAEGYGALELDPEDALRFGTFYLARRAPVRLRLLDENGLPLGQDSCRYEADWSGYPLTPDAAGRVTIPSLFEDRGGSVMDHRSFSLPLPPSGSEYPLRFGNRDEDQATSFAQVLLDVPIEEESSIPLWVLDEQGFDLGRLAEGSEVVPGRAWLFLGAPFSGVRASIVPLEFRAGERHIVEPRLEREPVLEVLLPEGSWLVSLEVGDDSITRWWGAEAWAPRSGVPPESEVVVLAQGSDVRRARLAPWKGVATLDLRGSEHVLTPAPKDVRPFEASFRVRGPDGQALTVVTEVSTIGPGPADLDPAPDLVRVAIPAGARFEVRLAAEGHVALWRTGVAVPGGTSFEDVTLPVASE